MFGLRIIRREGPEMVYRASGFHDMRRGPVCYNVIEGGEAPMSVTELLQSAQFVVDGYGNKKAVVFDYAVWEELLRLLEDLEDAEEMQRLREAGEEAVPWSQAKTELRTAGVDV